MSVEYSEFEELLASVKTIQKSYTQFIKNFLLEMGLRAIAQTKKRTPVDTGELRNHWQLQGVFRKGEDLYVVLFNPMHYASYVEYGHAKPYKAGAMPGSDDWVTGYFMCTFSIHLIEQQIPARFNAAFAQFMAGLGMQP